MSTRSNILKWIIYNPLISAEIWLSLIFELMLWHTTSVKISSRVEFLTTEISSLCLYVISTFHLFVHVYTKQTCLYISETVFILEKIFSLTTIWHVYMHTVWLTTHSNIICFCDNNGIEMNMYMHVKSWIYMYINLGCVSIVWRLDGPTARQSELFAIYWRKQWKLNNGFYRYCLTQFVK